MSREYITTFTVTIFNVSKANKPLIDGTIQISHNTSEKYVFDLSQTQLPQSCTFHSNSLHLKQKHTIGINISNKYNCFVVIPLDLYFSDSVCNEIVTQTTRRTTNANVNVIEMIPPTIILSITPYIPLPLIMSASPHSMCASIYYMNNVSPPLYEVNLTHKISQLISQFMDSLDAKKETESNRCIIIWNEIKTYIKQKKLRHIALYALFDKINRMKHKKYNKCVVSDPSYKWLHRLLHKMLAYAAPNNGETMDIISLYLVLCIARITHNHHLNSLIDDLECKWIMNIDVIIELIHYLTSTFNIDMYKCIRIILCFILIRETENINVRNKMDKLCTKLSLIHQVISDPQFEFMRQRLFEWILKPIANVLLHLNIDKSSEISLILSLYKEDEYYQHTLHDSYHVLLSTYYDDQHPIEHIDDYQYENGETQHIAIQNQGIKIPGLPIISGCIKLTNYRLIFTPFQRELIEYKTYKHYFSVPLGSIYNILSQNMDENDTHNVLQKQLLSYSKKKNVQITNYKLKLQIITKDGREINLLFAHNISHINLNKFIAELRRNSFCNDIEKSFALNNTIDIDGWKVYSFFEEFTRQKVPWHKWRICTINAEYKYCASYPSHFIVPSTVSDKQLECIQLFRSKSRIAVLTYYHHCNGAVIMRSSQPMIGIRGLGGFVSSSWWSQNRSTDDENVLFSADIKYIIDARPKMNAVVNAAAGGGYENTLEFYKGIKLIFGNIQNIHEVRKAYDALSKTIQKCVNKHDYALYIPHIRLLNIDEEHEHKEHELFDIVCVDEDDNDNDNKHNNNQNNTHNLYNVILRDDHFWASVLSSGWMQYVRSILVCAICIVSMVNTENKSVLIHCSDGWDRTAQLCSLSQILLDPYFRTIRGLAVLIEKEWISFGHRFVTRFGQTKDDISNDQRSPVFIQFLDCLHQIIIQFPNEFEYNTDLLSYIALHTTSCLYGTFLADSEKERICDKKLHQKTQSIWHNLLNDAFLFAHKLKNINYVCSKYVLYVDHRAINLSLWDYFTKMDPFPVSSKHRESKRNAHMEDMERHIELKQKDLEIKCLKKQNKELQKIEQQYQKIMKCIDTKNGFLLQNQVPIIPDLDYVSSHHTNTNANCANGNSDDSAIVFSCRKSKV